MGVSHPGRGAYSSYYPIVIQATSFVPRGSEIFVNYGISYDNRINYQDVDTTLESILSFFSKYQDQLTASQQEKLYSFLMNDIVPYSGSKTSDHLGDILQAFPTNLDDSHSIMHNGGSFYFHNPEAIKSQSWLESNGQCTDGLYVGLSSIPYAGTGVFARRSFSSGEVILPIPLLKIEDKTWLDMYRRSQSSRRLGRPYLDA